MVRVRPYAPDDHAFVLGLASRLLAGLPAWRDPQQAVAAFHKWIQASIDGQGSTTLVLVAEDDHGECVGFVTIEQRAHFTGEPEAYIHELVTSEHAEGKGVGKALILACEDWARAQGIRFLSLSANASNTRALGFYHHLGFLDEDIKLVKLL